MLSIRKRTWKNQAGKLRTGWQVSYVDGDGRVYQKQFQTRHKADHERIRIEREIARGVHVPDKRYITVGDAARAFLTDFEGLVEVGKRTRVTLRGYETHVRLHLLPFEVAEIKLSRLSGPNCVAYARALETSRSDDLAGKVYSTFRQILKFAWGQGWIGSNPARAVSIRKAPKWEADQECLEIPPLASLRALLEAAKTFDDTGKSHAIICLLLFQALRISEVRALGENHITVRSNAPEVRVRRKADRWNQLTRVKTNSSVREVPIGPETMNALRRWLIACPASDENLVFPNGAGKVENYHNIYNRLWIPLLTNAKVMKPGEQPPFSPHSLRHAGISLWIKNGASSQQVQRWAGHASIHTTWDIYGHLWRDLPDEQAAAAAAERSVLG
jgi:integrase